MKARVENIWRRAIGGRGLAFVLPGNIPGKGRSPVFLHRNPNMENVALTAFVMGIVSASSLPLGTLTTAI